MPIVIAFTLLLLLSLPAAARTPKTSEQWMTAVPPRAGLPAVDVSIGYPGGYIPRGYVPIALRARAGDRPFDGTIGFRFALRSQPAFDTPVVSRVRLRPGQSWMFSTWALVPSTFDRQLEIEWRDPAMRVLSTARVAKLPAHAARVLRVAGTEASAHPPMALGREAYTATMSDLSDEAQWYSAFSAMVLPTAVWLDLPTATRDAIFGSGIPVVFIGTPRPEQSVRPRDLALLPVTFEASPGSYRLPWPYGIANQAPRPAPMSWRPVANAWIVGPAQAPYIVSTGRGRMAWVADASAVDRPMPSLEATSMGRDRYVPHEVMRPAIRQLLRSHVPMIIAISVILGVFALWLLSRRSPRLLTIGVALLLSVVLIATRQRIRPLSDSHDIEVITPLSAGLVHHYRARFSAGAAPLEAEVRPPDLVRTSINGMDDMLRIAEVRTANTPPGAGSVSGYGDYEAIVRWSARREEGQPPTVRILRHDTETLTLEYDSPEPVDEIEVAWSAEGRLFVGGTTQNGNRSGTATVRNSSIPWQEGAWFIGTSLRGVNYVMPWNRIQDRHGVQVSLIHRTRTRTKEMRWSLPAFRKANEPLRITGTLRQAASSPGTLSGLFALPPAARLPGGAAFISLQGILPVAGVTLTWSSGNGVATAPSGEGSEIATSAFPIPPSVLKQIADSGGLFEVTVRGSGPLPAETNSAIELWGKPR